MTHNTWSAVDSFVDDLLELDDEVLRAALAASDEAGLPAIQVSPAQGRLLNLLARWGGARRILEIGTLAGYSAIWLARALPADGRLVTLELNERHAEVARANLKRAGLADSAEVIVGPALETLARLAHVGSDPFDLIFIDADKESYPNYLSWSLRLSGPGSLIVADNVVREGAVIEPDDPRARGVRRFLELVAADERLEATVIQTVGSKGYDGLAFARVR